MYEPVTYLQVTSPHSSGHLEEVCQVVWVEGVGGATALIARIRNGINRSFNWNYWKKYSININFTTSFHKHAELLKVFYCPFWIIKLFLLVSKSTCKEKRFTQKFIYFYLIQKLGWAPEWQLSRPFILSKTSKTGKHTL